MRLNNFWLVKAKEKTILKIVGWAQKQCKKMEELTNEDIQEAVKAQIRASCHS
jgi:hypothetical protein